MATKRKADAAKAPRAKGSLKERAARLLEIARKAFDGASDWQEFSNAVYGIGGPYSQMFPTREEREAFERTAEGKEVRRMMDSLMGGDDDGPLPDQPPEKQVRIVLRLPRSMFEVLRAEAEAEGVSIIMLCVAKLGMKLRDGLFLKC